MSPYVVFESSTREDKLRFSYRAKYILQKLPIGIQTFSEIIGEDYLYVDKTEAIYRLLRSGKYFFLSRPLRSGKSLTLSTIYSIYRGQRELFAGLWIEEQWDWEKIHPVIHISFSGLFRELIQKLADKGNPPQNKVVLLIDEYDKPIIDYLDEIEQAKTNQKILKLFYSVIKDCDPYIEFLLITGVSKFSKVSIFSELNNLTDITLDRRFASLTGYTQRELEDSFALHMPEVEAYLGLEHTELLAQLRHWYNGYSWDGRVYVYNPFSILNFLQKADFRNFWFETGTPTFLIKLIKERQLYKLDNLEVNELSFATYDIEKLQVLPILFQTGYLTIKAKEEFGLYQLGYPNQEVESSMLMYLIGDLSHSEPALTTPMVVHLYRAFLANDMEQIIKLIKSIFKNIPSQIFMAEAEAYYHSLIYLVFFYLGQYTESEVNTNDGRLEPVRKVVVSPASFSGKNAPSQNFSDKHLDCVVQSPTHIYILEFKLDKSADEALQQIKERGYADKYAADPRPKVLLGINFSREQKTVDGWQVETIDQ